MNPVVKGQVREFANKFGCAQLRESDQFELYSCYCVLNGLLGENIDPSAVHLSGDEFGIDSVALLVQGTHIQDSDAAIEILEGIQNPNVDFVFIQSKTSPSFDYGEMAKFFNGIIAFFEGSFPDISEQLEDLSAAKDIIYERAASRRNPTIRAYFVATGTYQSPALLEQLISTSRQKLLEMNIFDSVTISMVGAGELQKSYRTASSAAETAIHFDRCESLPSHPKVEQSFIGYISAKELLKVITSGAEQTESPEIKKNIFFDNIRDFDPDSDINKSITQSLASGQGQDFVFRNNGVTIVSRNIVRTGDTFKISDYQIVNGCQTSNIIFNNMNYIDDVFVPLRLIGTKDDDFISSIILGTNQQNPVRPEQLWALRPFMKSLEEYCRTLESDHRILFERRENQYRNQPVEKARIVQPHALLKAASACLLKEPHRAARDYKSLLKDNDSQLFQDDHDVRLYHSIGYLHYRLEFLWRNKRVSPSLKIFRYYIMAGIANRISEGRAILSAKRKAIEEFSAKLLDLCGNEDSFRTEVMLVADIAAKLAKEKAGIENREKLRDEIRRETFAREFFSLL